VEQWPHIRRLANGAIDYDFYRGKARAQRLAAIRDVLKPKRGSGPGTGKTFLARLRTAWRF
jgi:hypothetical protein